MEDRNDHIENFIVHRCWRVFLNLVGCYCLLSFFSTFMLTGFHIATLDWILSQPSPDYLIFLFMKGLMVSLLQWVTVSLSLYLVFKFSDFTKY